jgi:hypothetical protein
MLKERRKTMVESKVRQLYWLAGSLQSASFELMKVRDQLEGSKGPLRESLGRIKSIIEQLDIIQGIWIPHPKLDDE